MAKGRFVLFNGSAARARQRANLPILRHQAKAGEGLREEKELPDNGTSRITKELSTAASMWTGYSDEIQVDRD